MTQEGTRDLAIAAGTIAQSMADIGKHMQGIARAYADMGDAWLRIRVAVEPAEHPQDYAKDLPEVRQARGFPGDAPDHALRPEPWTQFLIGLRLTPAKAATLIRAELPDALRPTTDIERNTWPSVPEEGEPHELKAATDNELQRAAAKLTGLDGDKALAAQSMIRRLAGRRPR